MYPLYCRCSILTLFLGGYMKFRLIYILLTGLLFTGSLGYYNRPAAPAAFSHTCIHLQQYTPQLGAQIPDLPVSQFIISEDDRDEDDFSSLLRKPVPNHPGAYSPQFYSCFNDPLTTFRKNYKWSVYPVSDIYIVHRTFRI